MYTCNGSQLSQSYFVLINSKQLSINEPARITEDTESAVDSVIVSDKENINHSGVVPRGLSDNILTYFTRKVSKGTFNKHNKIKLRSLKNYYVVNLVEVFSKVDWYEVIKCENVNQAWNIFKHIFMLVVDGIAPIKTVHLKQRSDPWMDN